MSSISEIRALTGAVRPGGNHGCQPAELLPGLWAANYKDVDTTEKLAAVAAVSLVVNAGTDVCQTQTGSYGDGITVLRVENLNDDPEVRKKVREAASPNHKPTIPFTLMYIGAGDMLTGMGFMIRGAGWPISGTTQLQQSQIIVTQNYVGQSLWAAWTCLNLQSLCNSRWILCLMDRKSQLPLQPCPSSHQLRAPGMRPRILTESTQPSMRPGLPAAVLWSIALHLSPAALLSCSLTS